MDRLSPRREAIFIAALCVAAAIRVLVLSAAFPLFDNVDEQSHYDIVHRWSRLDVPGGMQPLTADTIRTMRCCESWEYLHTPDQYEGGRTPRPGWLMPAAVLDASVQQTIEKLGHYTNIEGPQPPLYYVLAGGWYRLGRLLGLGRCSGVFFIRFLNAPLVALFVWIVALVARALEPERAALRFGAPLLAAFLPQDAFYSIGNDALSPLVVGLAFLALLKIAGGASSGWGLHVLAGIAVSASVLTKLTNVPILAVAAAVGVAELAEARRVGRLPAALKRLGVLASAILLPCGALAARNLAVFGNLTGMAQKAERLGWTPKPASELLHHPIFTPSGLWEFLYGLLTSFWRGEFYWHGERLAWAGADWFYVLSSAAFLAAAVHALLARRGEEAPRARFGLLLGLLFVLLSVLLLVWGSIAYDFGGCLYPSREFPFFASGRLLGGALAPFLCLYVLGLDRLLSRFGAGRAALPLVIFLALAMATVQIVLSLGAFASPFNWFHMTGA
jgi:hypothetical protein